MMNDATISKDLRNFQDASKLKPTKTATNPKGGMWDRNGKILVEVLQRHIDEALERDSSHCVIAMAVAESVPDAKFICVDLQTIRWTRKNLRYVFLTPHRARDFLVAFDQGERAKLKPFAMGIRPCTITGSGKRRNQVPFDAELRGSGLTVAKQQPHIAAQRYNPDGSRNMDPNRTDGLKWSGREPAARGIVPEPRRQARAKVSTAHKGEVPTTLGGRLPPISVLSRREFGLRVLRK